MEWGEDGAWARALFQTAEVRGRWRTWERGLGRRFCCERREWEGAVGEVGDGAYGWAPSVGEREREREVGWPAGPGPK